MAAPHSTDNAREASPLAGSKIIVPVPLNGTGLYCLFQVKVQHRLDGTGHRIITKSICSVALPKASFKSV